MFALWLCARALAPFSLPAAAPADALFAIAVAWGIGRPIIASRNRNWFFILLVLAIGAASAAFNAWPRLALSVGMDLVLLIIAVMAGRVVPAFTNSAVPGAGARRFPWIEYGALGSVLFLLLLDLSDLDRAASVTALATHALTVGAIGGLTIGMMTRTARGHTARPLKAGGAEITAYVLVQLAAVVRVLLPLLLPAAYAAAIALSAALWSAAFAVFVVAYYPILSRQRLDGQPG